ncbi:MAG: hydantoinase/oxoprolinase family protein, partial [Pseudomonadota bacterium]
QYTHAKALTTHNNLSTGFMQALETACGNISRDVEGVLSELDAVRYATTLGTNALIERKGPRIGLITTKGHEWTVPLMRARGYGDGMPEEYQADLPGADRPVPLVDRTMIVGVRERIDWKGDCVLALDEDGVREAVRALVDKGAQAFVVGLLNATLNPDHEKRIEQIILDEYPAHFLGGLPVILSHKVVGRKGEYARTMSAILDAYLHDIMHHGLSGLEVTLRSNGYSQPMLVTHNTGGMAQLNSTHALQTIHSGPVAGLGATESLSAQYNEPNIIATDMGGTSFDIGIVTGDGVKFYDFNPVIDRFLVATPMVYLHTLGAGGGSIARIDEVWGSVAVGPESAGSDPGPACYGRGGKEPTTTDANLVLGYLDAENYAGGSIKLNRRRAERSIQSAICEPTGMTVTEAALAIRRKVDANMADAIFKEVAVKGYDPRDFSVLSYGGGGPLHACGFASRLGVKKVIIPPFSSVFSALGAGNMNQLHIHEKSVYVTIYDPNSRQILRDPTVLNEAIEELSEKGRADLKRQGVADEDVRLRVEVDMRYGNQRAQTAVVAPIERFDSLTDIMNLVQIFSETYEQRFGDGSRAPEAGIRVQVVRVVAYVDHDDVRLEAYTGAGGKSAAPARSRECWFDGNDAPVDTPIYDHGDLGEGVTISGPALIESTTTTFLVEPGWELTTGKQGAAVMVQRETNGAARQ